MTWSRPILYGFSFWVLVLIAAQVCRGQDTTSNVFQKSVTLYPEYSPIKYERILSEDGLVRLWDEWKDSCWSDSTVTLEYRPCHWTDPNCVWRQHGDQMTKETKEKVREVTHRDPNNLQEFIEFIRRRTK